MRRGRTRSLDTGGLPEIKAGQRIPAPVSSEEAEQAERHQRVSSPAISIYGGSMKDTHGGFIRDGYDGLIADAGTVGGVVAGIQGTRDI